MRNKAYLFRITTVFRGCDFGYLALLSLNDGGVLVKILRYSIENTAVFLLKHFSILVEYSVVAGVWAQKKGLRRVPTFVNLKSNTMKNNAKISNFSVSAILL